MNMRQENLSEAGKILLSIYRYANQMNISLGPEIGVLTDRLKVPQKDLAVIEQILLMHIKEIDIHS